MEFMEGKTLSTGLATGVAAKLCYEMQRTFSSANLDEADSIMRADVQAECERMADALQN